MAWTKEEEPVDAGRAVTMRYAHLAPGNLTAAVSVFDSKRASGSTHRWNIRGRQKGASRKAL